MVRMLASITQKRVIYQPWKAMPVFFVSAIPPPAKPVPWSKAGLVDDSVARLYVTDLHASAL
jgi:hypothetical protein